MSKENLDMIIGEDAVKGVEEMGGVMSKVYGKAVHMVANGKLTPEEGLEVFRWGVKKEAEIEKQTDPKDWEQMRYDSMSGKLLRDRGENWFRERVNELASSFKKKPIYQ